MKTVSYYTLGCKLNFSETSAVGRIFEERGYTKRDFGQESDVILINTCSVTENADKKCSTVVKQARKASPDAFIAVMGCFAQLKPDKVATITGVDAVLGASEKFRLFDLIEEFTKQPETLVYAGDIENATTFHSAYSINDRTRTFLKVQDGCNYSCTFCTIPLARGSSRSDEIDNIVAKARKIGQSGVKEIVLTGVNTGDYGIIDGQRKYRFIDLIRALDEVEEVFRFRISSIEPNLLSDEIIEFVAHSKRFMPHFHMPLQSGSDEILKKMKRRYLSDLYIKRIEKIKNLIPQACIGVDVITGFPGETEQLFNTTYEFLNEQPISYLHVFTYSERENTEAIKLDGVVPYSERKKRSKMLRILSEKKRSFFYRENVNSIQEVLLEDSEKEPGMLEGFTPNYVRVQIEADNQLEPNTLLEVSLESQSTNEKLRGNLLQRLAL